MHPEKHSLVRFITIGPYFFKDAVNGENQREMISTFIAQNAKASLAWHVLPRRRWHMPHSSIKWTHVRDRSIGHQDNYLIFKVLRLFFCGTILKLMEGIGKEHWSISSWEDSYWNGRYLKEWTNHFHIRTRFNVGWSMGLFEVKKISVIFFLILWEHIYSKFWSCVGRYKMGPYLHFINGCQKF